MRRGFYPFEYPTGRQVRILAIVGASPPQLSFTDVLHLVIELRESSSRYFLTADSAFGAAIR